MAPPFEQYLITHIKDYNLLCSNFLWLILSIMYVAPPFEQTYPRTICVQYLKILFSRFGEEDF